MRIGVRLWVGVGIFSVIVGLAGASGCTANTSPDEVCTSAGGVCLLTTDMVGCAEQLEAYPCNTGYSCCAVVDAATGSGTGTSTPPVADAANGG
jgi:hypothetical protein